jgi:Leu/Phe-tRNA-protein transferase
MAQPDPIQRASAEQQPNNTTSTSNKPKSHKKSPQKPKTKQPPKPPKRHAIEAYIPQYLKPFIHPYHGDFCYTRSFHYKLIVQLMAEGFLPIATDGILLPKLHEHRCVVSLPEQLHVSKSVRKKSKKFTITINQAFPQVVQGCRTQHGTHCWLYDPLVEAFWNILQAGHVDATLLSDNDEEEEEDEERQQRRHPPRRRRRVAPVRLYSIEIWNATTGDLAGGELGYTVGSIYTSLTGFSAQDTAGSVQLVALGRLLCHLGFTLWDLGMEMSYKTQLGSHLMARDDFVAHVHRVREESLPLLLPQGAQDVDHIAVGHVNAKTIIDTLPCVPVLAPTTITSPTATPACPPYAPPSPPSTIPTTNDTHDTPPALVSSSLKQQPLSPIPTTKAPTIKEIVEEKEDCSIQTPSVTETTMTGKEVSPPKHRQASPKANGRSVPVEKKQRNVSPDNSKA